MAKSVAQINRELAKLEEQSQEMGQELKGLYGSYLDELSQVAYQQIISVCYELCTQFYPALFLKLSFKDRDKLQRQIKQQGKALRTRLHMEQLFQPDESELEALEAALIDGLDLVAGAPPHSERNELPTLEIPGLESTPPHSPPPNVDKAAQSLDIHAPDLNLSGLSLAESASETAPKEADAANSEQPPENHGVSDGGISDSSISDGDRPEHNASSPELNPSSPAHPDPNRLERSNADQLPTESGITPEREDDNEPRQLPITLIPTEGEPLSPGMLASAIAAEAEDDAADRPSPLPANIAPIPSSELELPTIPREMILWQERLERTISQRLRQSSQRMTRLLEKSGVLNNQLPDGLLAASSDSDEEEETAKGTGSEDNGPRRPEQGSNKSPHILSLMLEPAGSSKKKGKGEPIQIVAIYLRLSEIEFATPLVMGWRNRIRTKVKALKQLANQYEHLEQERAIAEAEDAWRSTWSNE